MRKQYLFMLAFLMLVMANTHAQFVDSGQDYSFYSNDVEVVDVDNDGDLDIVFGRSYASGADYEHLWVNDGNGNYTLQVVNNTILSNYSRNIESADINGDGYPEFFTANRLNGSNLYNNINGTLSQSSANYSNFTNVAFGNYDNDSDLDMFVVKQGSPNEVFRYRNNNGSLVQAVTPIITNVNEIADLKVRDMNLDGFLDIVILTKDVNVGSGSNNRFMVYNGDGQGNFTNTVNQSVIFQAQKLKLVKLVGTAVYPDVVVVTQDPGNSSAGKIAIYSNQNGSAYSFESNFGESNATNNDVAFGDFDNDGDLDAYVANNGENRVWLNNGSAIFSIGYTGLGTANSKAVKLADIDGDGDLDAVVANNRTTANEPSKIWLNNFIVPNTAPIAVGTISNISQVENNTTNQTIDLTQYFADAEDGASGLTYSVTTTDPSYFSTSVSVANLSVNFGSGFGGPDTVIIQAEDSEGLTVTQSFTVTVTQQQCTTPTNVSASNISFFDADISWTGSSDAANGYQWYVMAQGEVPNQGGATPVANGSTASGTTTASVTGLDFSTDYDVYVEALCSATATSTLSSVTSFTTLTCQSVTNLTSSNITDEAVTVSWIASPTAFNGYAWYLMNPGEVPGQDTPINNGTVTAAQVTVTGLSATTSYDLYIQSVCATNFGSALNAFVSFTTTNVSCAAPANLSASNISATSLDLSWTASADAANGYRWYVLPSGSTDTTQAIETNVTTSTSVNVNASNLTAGTSYDAYVVSRCSSTVNSILSVAETFTMPSASCAAPTNLSALNISTASLDLSWTASADATNGYRWYVLPSGSTDTTQAIETNVTTGTSVNVNASNLIASTSYDAYVVSRCSGSIDSGLSLVETFTMPAPVTLISMSSLLSSVSEGVGSFDIIITASQTLTNNVDFILGSSSSSASSPDDYTYNTSNVYTIPAGTTSTVVNIVINDDNDLEALESIVIDILNVTNAQIDSAQQQVEVLIVDNESSNISFVDSGQSLVTLATDVVLGGIDGSSGLDALFSKSNFNNRLFLNDGSGVMSNSGQTIGSGSGATNKIAVGNFVGSNNNDVILANSGQDQVWLNSSGTYTFDVNIGANSTNSYSVTTEDIDSDGFDDVIIGKTDEVEVYINDYITNNFVLDFSLSQTLSLPNSNNVKVKDVKLADLDGTGGLDLIVITEDLNYVFASNTSGTFATTPVTLPGGSLNSTGVDTFDIDANGFDDIVISNYGAPNQVIMNVGTFGALNFELMPLTPLQTLDSTGVVFADFDNDSDMDVAFSNEGKSTFWENVGGVFANNDFFISSLNFDSLALDAGDIDGDGDKDIIFANAGSNASTASKIWFNNLQTLSTTDFDIQSNVKLYPNPVKNQFKIDVQNRTIEKVEVFNIQGQLVKTFKVSESYNINDLESGVYFVKIQTQKTIRSIKIVKE